jgi:GH25 family lysozyme M1 (1,4-beta-N-acetylmuramidase)/predicted lipoprotein with Yx(FWY)xxD motif
MVMKKVVGADVSFYENDPQTPEALDFNKMKKAADFVIIRAGQNLWPDPDFEENWLASRQAGLPRGSYWYYDSRIDPGRQADLWYQLLDGEFGELPLFADFEESFDGRYKGWRNWYDFLEHLRSLVGDKEIGIYSSYSYWRDNAPRALVQNDQLEYFHRYPLWIANYGVQKPAVPKPWGADEWLFWQFSEVGNGRAYGVESKGIDLNYFNGDLQAFQHRFKLPAPELESYPVSQYMVDLSVRAQPDNRSSTVGILKQNDLVEVLDATSDGDWLKIHRQDGVNGWSRSRYVIRLEDPLSTTIDQTGDSYLVMGTALNLREGPAASFKILGTLKQDEIVDALRTTVDGRWLQVRREDGLTGWCYNQYLVKLGKAAKKGASPPSALKENLFEGADYSREVYRQPRNMVVHILALDLQNGQMQFLVTPPDRIIGTPLCTRTTSRFLVEHKLQIAVNGDGFSFPSPAPDNPLDLCRNGGDPARPNGFAASRGRAYSKKNRIQPVMYMSINNFITFNQSGGVVYNALAGDRMLVEKGKPAAGLTPEVPEPRTAVGIDQKGRSLILMVVDGRQPEYSRGATLTEWADLLIKFGVYTGMNLDGGGSSTMVVEGKDGRPRLMNSPVDNNVPGRERAVANHLGIYVRK